MNSERSPNPKEQPALVIPQLIVGLGNPGSKYDGTRHNIGFDIVDELARRWNASGSAHKKFHGWFAEAPFANGQKLRLLKPSTYMNRSGQSIRAVLDWYKLPQNSVLIVYDDMDLPVGRIRLRLSGSAGGHNGMKSAIAHLGTQDFPRLRVGIGSSKSPDTGSKDTVSHVLGKFSPSEAKIINDVIPGATDAVETSLKQGVEQAMNLYNNRLFAALEQRS
ncbi:aminoacyl-tRNA hydrolase [Roseofilum capinflatum]|uniref:Peptidyl-tRNA hydrolase n=1 Tax=Roseofilum capinflatum BLCC-M114 TaxID=3022440 RepID=A0ABT7B868_9CYAN|nr:aminoacyl-tRNA hydrolase [Roseofilum capinflatum]MDJ1175367.1 aminoacyl-tRNA hydrolase [Roseofilum capinflatum BLCC-M114]